MEVHHHPHVEKKNFKEYFLEFLMIFLAVTMGFFAENIRERLVNKEKEEHYIQNLIADLRVDSVQLTLTITRQGVESNMLDSALKTPIQSLANIKVQDMFFHYIYLYYSYVPTFEPSTNTISQLKTGGFNIVRNEATVDSINHLYLLYNEVGFDTKYNETNYWDVAHKAQSIMLLPEPAVSWDDPLVKMIPDNRKIFLTNDYIAIAQLYNVVGNSRGSFKTCIDVEKHTLMKVAALIAFLKRQYHVE